MDSNRESSNTYEGGQSQAGRAGVMGGGEREREFESDGRKKRFDREKRKEKQALLDY